MKSSKRSFLILLTLILTISLLSACSSKSDMSSLDFAVQTGNEFTDGNKDFAEEEGDEKGESLGGEKIISTYYINLETLDFEEGRDKLEALIKENKAYIENSNIGFRGYEYSKRYRYGSFSIRIPKENIEKFSGKLKKIGNITNESKDTQDVSKFYRDTQSRLDLVTAKEKRLLELLEKAVKVEDIIAIESELTDTIYEKEMLEKDLKSIDERIDYTSLNLEITEVRNFSNTENMDSSLLLRLKNAFKDSLYAFNIAIENLIIWLVFALPYIVIFGVLVILGTIFIRKRRNK